MKAIIDFKRRLLSVEFESKSANVSAGCAGHRFAMGGKDLVDDGWTMHFYPTSSK